MVVVDIPPPALPLLSPAVGYAVITALGAKTGANCQGVTAYHIIKSFQPPGVHSLYIKETRMPTLLHHERKAGDAPAVCPEWWLTCLAGRHI